MEDVTCALQVDTFCLSLTKEVTCVVVPTFTLTKPVCPLSSDCCVSPVIVSTQAEQLVSKFFPQKMEELQTLLKVVRTCRGLVSGVTWCWCRCLKGKPVISARPPSAATTWRR